MKSHLKSYIMFHLESISCTIQASKLTWSFGSLTITFWMLWSRSPPKPWKTQFDSLLVEAPCRWGQGSLLVYSPCRGGQGSPWPHPSWRASWCWAWWSPGCYPWAPSLSAWRLPYPFSWHLCQVRTWSLKFSWRVNRISDNRSMSEITFIIRLYENTLDHSRKMSNYFLSLGAGCLW